MQEDVYASDFSADSEITDFEKEFSVLDAAYFAGETENDENFKKKAQNVISRIDSVSKDFALKKAALSRLYAIEGLVFFDLGSKGDAKRFYELSCETFKGDARALILSARLGIEKNSGEKMGGFSDKSLFVLETALQCFSEQDYASAVAKFDEAFLTLESFYQDAYSELRGTSWNLKNLPKDADSRYALLLAQKNLTVMQMLLLANQNPETLFNYTAGKNLSDKDLYVKIAGSGLLNPASKPLDAENALTKNAIVTRLVAARFLWNLYNDKKNSRNMLTKYSKAFDGKKRSPIPDIKLDNPDFDAVLGCVENEIMHLEDGIDFGGEKEVSGVEFNESVTKVGN